MHDISTSLDLWVFTEAARDRGTARGCCGLCGRCNLRFQFQVRHRISGDEMWVGSRCILKFDLSVMQGQTRLTPPEARRKLARITRALRG